MKIILFEDSPSKDSLLAAIRKELGDKGSAEIFEAGVLNGTRTYEDRLFDELAEEKYKNASLLVADRDLSSLEKYSGLSEQIVWAVSERLGIPECRYARGDDPELDLSKIQDVRISIPLRHGDAEFARRVVEVADGFESIGKSLEIVLTEQSRLSPGEILAQVLDKPEYAEQLTLYASGDRERVSNVLKGSESGEERVPRLKVLFGNMLWTSVLRYPGVVVNEVAAASYLNIDPNDWKKPDVQDLFKEAKYTGPFGNIELNWWRGMLDDIVAQSESDDGRGYAKAKLGTEIGECRCSEKPENAAGFYCMLSGLPVSLEASRPGLTWFPRGADLARISNSKSDELLPWLDV